MSKWLRHLWHEVYYKLAPPSGEALALTCREAVERIDLPEGSLTERLRLRLHLSLCQACARYFEWGLALKRTAKNLMRGSETRTPLKELNRDLQDKFARPRRPRPK